MSFSSTLFLDQVFLPLSSLPGVGPRTRALLKHLVGERVQDLLYHFPVKMMERRFFSSVRELIHCFSMLEEGVCVTLNVQINGTPQTNRRGGPLRVRASDETGFLDLVFFHANPKFLTKKIVPGSTVLVSGRPAVFGGKLQISHPDFIGPISARFDYEGFEAIYPLTSGLSNQVISRIVKNVFKTLETPPEWLDEEFLRLKKWPTWKEALQTLHKPRTLKDIEVTSPARQRLAYDEMLAQQIRLILARQEPRVRNGRSHCGTGILQKSFLNNLSFELTSSQKKVISEVASDMARETKMLRLLQGDVGAGKTVVAFLSMLIAIESGAQAALLVPTEILAQQHFKTLEKWGNSLGLHLALLTRGNSQKKEGQALKTSLQKGEINLIIGTHALLEEDTRFQNLGLVVIDEQHRFGVEQRLKLMEKGGKADVLVMTATPIPRTLQLAAFGDMDVSLLNEKPKERKPIITRILPIDRMEEVVISMQRLIDKQQKIYWVCPLVEESETLDLTAAQNRFHMLRDHFGEDAVVLIHGRMKPKEKEETMEKFTKGSAKILVATTVIEVGVDVKEATLMIIEHAERFGLAQLHQLRGRIGRGEKISHCLLLYASPLSPLSRQRLSIMRETEDGFRIAEEDLKIRGAGDLLGVHQSGYNIYKIADLFEHESLLALAQREAHLILKNDPLLMSERGQVVRCLLHLFYREKNIKYLLAG